MIPAVAHFIWFGSELPWANALAIRSAALRGGFDAVVLRHADDLSHNDIWPELQALPGFEARRIDEKAILGATGSGGEALLEIYRRLDHPAARANMLRAAILYNEGGVYLDLDTVTLRPMAELRNSCGAFCGEEYVLPLLSSLPPGYHPLALAPKLIRFAARIREMCRRLPNGWRYFRLIERWYPRCANNAVLGAEPRHPLIRRLLDGMIAMPKSKQRVRFALGVDLLQKTLAQSEEPDFRLLPPRAFYPLAPVISHHWFQILSGRPSLDAVLDPETLVVHWYASIDTRKILPRIDADYVREHADRQLFSALVLPLLDLPPTGDGRHAILNQPATA